MNYDDASASDARLRSKLNKSKSSDKNRLATKDSTASSQKLKRIWIYSSTPKGYSNRFTAPKKVSSPNHVARSTPKHFKMVNGFWHKGKGDGTGQKDVLSYLKNKERRHTDIAVKRFNQDEIKERDESNMKKRKTDVPIHSTVVPKDVPELEDVNVASNSKPIDLPGELQDETLSQIDMRKYLLGMSEKILSYEVKIASLHGRLSEMRKQNTVSRNDDKYRLLCSKLAGQLVAETKDKLSRKVKASQRGEKKIQEENTVSNATKQPPNELDGGERVEATSPDNTKSLQTIYTLRDNGLGDCNESNKKLQNLEEKMLERLKQYEEALSRGEDETSKIFLNSMLLKDDSPFVEGLRTKLLEVTSELEKVRRYANTRVSNLKIVLERERTSRQMLERTNEDFRKRFGQWENFGRNVQAQMAGHIQVINEHKDHIAKQNAIIEKQIATIGHQREALIDLRHKVSNTQIPKIGNPITYNELFRVSTNQKREIEGLKQFLHDEKLKSDRLTEMVQQLRQHSAEKDKSASEYVRLSLLAAQKDAEDRHRLEIRALHNMYGNLLKNVEMRNIEGKEMAQEGPYRANGPSASPQIKREISSDDLISDQAMVTLESPKANK